MDIHLRGDACSRLRPAKPVVHIPNKNRNTVFNDGHHRVERGDQSDRHEREHERVFYGGLAPLAPHDTCGQPR